MEYIFQALDRLLARYPIEFIKWDMNRNASEPGSVAGKTIWRKHVEGVYNIMDRLRQNYPKLDIQSCSGGGGRIDLGILGRTDQVWTSDNADVLDRICIQEGYNATYVALDRHDAEVYLAGGYELMTQGIPGDTGQRVAYSRTLYVKQL